MPAPGSQPGDRYRGWMRLRTSVPGEVKNKLTIEPGERILASDRDASDRWWVGTNLALNIPEESGHRRLPWERIDAVQWDRDAEVLRITETAPFGEPTPTTTARVAPSSRLLRLIRERVMASIVVNRHVPLYGKEGVRVLARRRPGTDDALVWSMAFDASVDPADPTVLADAEVALAHIREQIES